MNYLSGAYQSKVGANTAAQEANTALELQKLKNQATQNQGTYASMKW
jgi:hypothetical protein